jgi:hypothetical protein
MKSKFILPLVFLFITIHSCKKSEEFQFTLYLEYTASVNNCKTINVTIDGQEKLTNQICSAGVSPNVTILTFPISSGKHNIKAVIIEDSKVFNRSVDFDTSLKYGYLTYNNNSSEFTFFLNSTGGID